AGVGTGGRTALGAVISAGSVLSTVLRIAVLLAARHAVPAVLLASGTALLAAVLLTAVLLAAGTAHTALTSRAPAGLALSRRHHCRRSDRSPGEAADDEQ